MRPAAKGLHQQGHTELHKKTSSMRESWAWTFRLTFWIRNEKRCYLTPNAASNYLFFCIILWNAEKNTVKAIIFEATSDDNISSKFSRIAEKSFPVNPEILVEKYLSIGCREAAFCPVGHFILNHPVCDTTPDADELYYRYHIITCLTRDVHSIN